MTTFSQMFGAHHREMVQHLGWFVLVWSHIEATLEYIIYKQTKLDPLDSSIITSGLATKARLSIALALLHREKKPNAELVAALKKLQNYPTRNALMHGIITFSKDKLYFDYRRPTDKFTVTRRIFTAPELLALVKELGDLGVAIQTHAGMSEPDVNDFLHTSYSRRHNV